MTPTTPSKRGRVIAYYDESPTKRRSVRDIAKKVNLSPSTTHDIIRRWRERGHVYDHKSSGRPPLLSARAARHLLHDLHLRIHSPWHQFAQDHGISVSTVRRFARQHGIISAIARPKCFLSKAHQHQRATWGKENARQSWRRVIFSDEMSLELGGRHRLRVLRPIGEAHNSRYVQPTFRSSRSSIMLWGAIAHGKKWPLLRFDLKPARMEEGRKVKAQGIDSEVYCEQVLWERLSRHVEELTLEGREVLSVEDNAPSHNSRRTNALRTQMGISRLNHCPNSPDLNPIEFCWFLVKRKIYRMARRPTNLDELWVAAQQAWEEISIETVNRLVASMEERAKVIVQVKGMHTRW